MSKGIGILGALSLLCMSATSLAQTQTSSSKSGSSLRMTVVEVVPTAHRLAAALADVLAERNDIGTVIDPDDARSWFALCVDDDTDRCFTNVCKSHQIDLVLRAWATAAGGKLSVSIDFVRPHEHGLQTFEESGIDANNPDAIHACAERAVEKILGKKETPAPTPPIVSATPTTRPEVTPTSATPPPTAVAPSVTETSSGPSGLRVASYATAGIGAAALVLGIVEGLRVNSENSTINANSAAAQSGDASARAQVGSAYGNANSASTIANIGFAVGGAAVAAGVVMFFLSPSHPSTTAASVTVVNGGPALAVSGKF